MVAPR
jgi:uncharacterized protein